MIFLHPTFKAVWRASYMSAADWRYKSMQFIRQMVFLSSFHEKSVTIFSIFHLPLLSWQFHKVAKIITGNLFLLPANSAFDIFAVKSEKKTPSQIWWCYISHPNTITFREMKCVPSLQEKDADLQDRFVHSQLSPKED